MAEFGQTDSVGGNELLPHNWKGLENILLMAIKLLWQESGCVGQKFAVEVRGCIQGSQGLPHIQKSLTKFGNQKSGIRKLCSHKIRKLFLTIRLAPTEFWAPTQSGIRNYITVTITVSSVNISASSYQSPSLVVKVLRWSDRQVSFASCRSFEVVR